MTAPDVDRPLPPLDVLDALPVAVALIGADGRIDAWNTAAEVLYGHRRDEVLGVLAGNVLFEQEDLLSGSELLADVAAGKPFDGDCRVRRRDGVLLVSSFRGVPLPDGGVAWIGTDGMDLGLAEQEREVLLSAEHAARNAAEEARGLVEAIVSSAPVGIAVFDMDLCYVRVNDAYAALTGIAADDHVGGRVGEVDPLPPEVGADLRRVVTTGRTLLGRPIRVAAGADGDRHFTVSYFPVRSTSGALMGAGATVVDITEAKRAELERASLLEQAEVAQRRLAILATASTVLTTTMEIDELLNRLARVLTPSAADWCVIQLFNDRGAIEHVGVSFRDAQRAAGLELFIRQHALTVDDNDPIAEVLRSGRPQLLGESEVGAALAAWASDRGRPEKADEFALRSSVVVPIELRGTTHGVLMLSTDTDRVLDEDDLDLAVEIAHRAALAIANARAFQQEHQIAENLQRALLPASVPTVAGMQIAVRYVAATDGASVGGDWYDVIDFGGGSIGIAVGDVIGHDITASTTMGQVRSALRAYACEDATSPGDVMARLDRLFTRLDLTYATCVLGLIDGSGTFRWSSAGHPPPLLIRDGRTSFLSEGRGVMLGVTTGVGHEEATIALEDGDFLVLYTDGLVERRGESLGDGLSRLAIAASALDVDDPDDLCDALLSAVLPESTLDDDVAMLVVRIGDNEPIYTHRLDLPTSPDAAATARGFVAGVLGRARTAVSVETAVLLVSELVTNAIRHAAPPCALVVNVLDDGVELAVEDADPTIPRVRPSDPLADDGRGFLIVNALSDEWGIRPAAGGKQTWCVLRAHG